MKFKFSLEPVLKVRKHKEKLQKQKLAEEISRRKEIGELQRDVKQQLNRYLQNTQGQKVQNIHILKRQSKHVEQVHRRMKELTGKLAEAEKAVTNERQKLAEAHKSRHIMEKMREFEQKRFAEKMAKQDQKNMDEIATQSFSR